MSPQLVNNLGGIRGIQKGHLSLEAKENIVRKALNRGSSTLITIAKENNVGYSTIQRWIKAFGSGPLKGSASAIKLINKSAQLNHIIATASLDDISLGKYCRQQGLYSYQLKEWRAEMIKTTDDAKKTVKKSDLKQLKQENASLKKELRRKEKALAEASALLIMKKKAHLIWGEDEED